MTLQTSHPQPPLLPKTDTRKFESHPAHIIQVKRNDSDNKAIAWVKCPREEWCQSCHLSVSGIHPFTVSRHLLTASAQHDYHLSYLSCLPSHCNLAQAEFFEFPIPACTDLLRLCDFDRGGSFESKNHHEFRVARDGEFEEEAVLWVHGVFARRRIWIAAYHPLAWLDCGRHWGLGSVVGSRLNNWWGSTKVIWRVNSKFLEYFYIGYLANIF